MEHCIFASYLENKSKKEYNNWQATTSMFIKGENLVISRLLQIQMQPWLNICQLCIQKSPADNSFNSNWCNIFDRKVLKKTMDFGDNFCDEVYHRQQLLSLILFCSFSNFVIARRCWEVWIVNRWPTSDNDLLLLVDQVSLICSASWSWSQHSVVERGRNIEEKYKQRSSCIKMLISASSDYDQWVHQHPIQMRWRPCSGH